MPYSGKDDPKLPKHIQDLPEKLRTAWVKAWNASYETCQTKNDGSDCEGYAFGTATNVVKRIQEKEKAGAEMSAPDIDALIIELKDTDPNVGGGVNRDEIPDEDFIDPKGRRFPIVEPKDVGDAVSSYGRADPKIPMDKFKARLVAICKRKGESFVKALPKEWKDELNLTLPAGESLDAFTRSVYEAFNSKMRLPSFPQPSTIDSWIQEIFEDHAIVHVGDANYLAPFTVDGDKITFAPQTEWKAVVEKKEWIDVPEANLGLRANIDPDGIDIPVTELSVDTLAEGKAFDGLAVGEFVDMSGIVVKFKEEEFQDFLDNTLEAIEATKTESGEVVGLPIDAHGHDKGDGAGWIVGAKLEGGKLRFIPKWTEIGKDLIEKGIRRFFSASVDLKNKVILGGTLTNWPAVRDKKGRVLLRPVELQYQIQFQEADVTKTITMTEDELQKLIEKKVAEASKIVPPPVQPGVELESLLGLEGLSEEAKKQRKEELRRQAETWRKQAELEWKQEMARMQHEDRTVELAQELVGGSETAPRGFRVAAEELQLHLLKLDPDEAKFFGDLLKKTQKDGFIEFGEVGHGKNLTGTKELPAEYAAKLDAGTLTIADLAAPEANLGDLAQYNLGKWKQ